MGGWGWWVNRTRHGGRIPEKSRLALYLGRRAGRFRGASDGLRALKVPGRHTTWCAWKPEARHLQWMSRIGDGLISLISRQSAWLIGTCKRYFEVRRRENEQPTIQNPFYHSWQVRPESWGAFSVLVAGISRFLLARGRPHILFWGQQKTPFKLVSDRLVVKFQAGIRQGKASKKDQ